MILFLLNPFCSGGRQVSEAPQRALPAENYESYGLSLEFLRSHHIELPLVERIFVANVSFRLRSWAWKSFSKWLCDSLFLTCYLSGTLGFQPGLNFPYMYICEYLSFRSRSPCRPVVSVTSSEWRAESRGSISNWTKRAGARWAISCHSFIFDALFTVRLGCEGSKDVYIRHIFYNFQGTCIIEYSHPLEAVQAVSMFNNQKLLDRNILVKLDKYVFYFLIIVRNHNISMCT